MENPAAMPAEASCNVATPETGGQDRTSQPFGLTREALFGECTVDTTVPDPTATFRIVDAAGKVRYQQRLTRSQLTPGRQ